MPTYEYRCKSCGAQFDVWQKMSDDPLTICPTCGESIHRVLFPAGIVFKGGGFYSTDQRANGASAPESPAAKAGESGAPASGDAKPAAESKPVAESPVTPPAKSK